MIRKLIVLLLTGVICLIGVTSALAATYNEAPMLRILVAAGELPPVEERIPGDPVVREPLEEIGEYGGTMHVFACDDTPWNDMQGTERGNYLLRTGKDGTIEGGLAKSYTISDDLKTFTLYLRKGVRWSDGAPFTADDIVFVFEDMHWNDKVTSYLKFPAVKEIEKVDDYTVRFEMGEPSPILVMEMARWCGGGWSAFNPKHYLKKWHIKYNPDADKLAKEEGFENWWNCLFWHSSCMPQRDVNKPTMYPWQLTEFTSSIKRYVRNPYYPTVDTAGNQLPYVDEIVAHIVTPEVYQLKIVSGEADVAWFGTLFNNYPLYKDEQEAGDYRVVLIPGLLGAEVAFGVNLNIPDPGLRELYQNKRFRQALSLAIDREEINEVVYFGFGVPRQATILPSASYYKEEWGRSYADYDPDAANRLLDEIGLTQRDEKGFRIGVDGKTILLLVEFSLESDKVAPITLLELVKEYWEAVGLKTTLKSEAWSYYSARRDSVDHGLIVDGLGKVTEEVNYSYSRSSADLIPPGGDFGWANAWGEWLDAEYKVKIGRTKVEDFEGGKLPGEEPPESIKQLVGYQRARTETAFRSKEYMELSEKFFDWHAENVVLIGTVGMVPLVYIAKNDIGNVPTKYGRGGEYHWVGDLNHFAEQLFFKQ